MSRKRLTGWRAVWLGLFATPALLVATVLLLGVTAGSAGPSTSAVTVAAAQATSGVTTQATALGSGQQTLQELMAYWTPERMADATPKVLTPTTAPERAEGSMQSAPSGGTIHFARMQADGSVSESSYTVEGGDVQPLHEPYHGDIPFTRWQYFAKYLPNTVGGGTNVAVSAQAKMFFTQGASNFVCSASTIGQDAVWTAAHCLSNGAGAFSTNVLFCPSYDNGVNAQSGCWGADSLTVSSVFHSTGDGDYDIGGANASNTGTIRNQTIGSFTGWLGIAYVATTGSELFNANWISFGYPQAAPFNGLKIHVCASSLGYQDAWTPGNVESKSIGCDMTGGSSGGPWILNMVRPAQIGGTPPPGLPNTVFGHNGWRHTAETRELNSPSYNCLAIVVYRIINNLAPVACP